MSQSALTSIEAFARAKLAELSAHSLQRTLVATRRSGVRAERAGRNLISFCDNDYLGLSQHPAVRRAAAQAALNHGVGAGGSRLVAGEHPLYRVLETRLAGRKRMPAARVFGSGYLANLGTIPVLAGSGDLIVMDERAHACMHAGARLSGAEVRRFRHNDARDAARQLSGRAADRRALLLTETVFSMDGDLAPLRELGELADESGAWLMTDDAHGFGVVERDNPAPLQMGTLSKAVGGYGGYVCGPAALIELLASRARSLVYTTALPPPVLAAALAALDVMDTEPSRGQRAIAHARRFAMSAGLMEPQSPIVPVIIGDAERALRASEALRAHGLLVPAIRPPTVAEGSARLRVSFSAAHRTVDVERLAQALARWRREEGR